MKTINKRALMAISIVIVMLLSSFSAAAITAGNVLEEASISTLDDNDYTVVYEGDMSKSEYAFSPSICVVENGTYTGRIVASWDVNSTTKNIPANASVGSVGHVAYSDDGGKTFTDAALNSDDFIFATVFEAGNALYLMARQSSTRYLVVCKSTDGGATWGAFTTLENTCTWHTAPSGAYYRNGQVFLAWENGASGRGSLSPVLWWADTAADLSVSANWSHSTFSFPYSNRVGNNSANGQRGTYENTDYLGVPYWGGVTNNLGWLEANVTEIMDENSYLYDPNGNTLYCYMRATLANSNYGCICKFTYNTSTGLWAPSDVQAPSGEKMIFTQLPGGNNKFHLTVDEQTGIQWLLASVNSDSMNPTQYGNNKRMCDAANERKDLGLYYSSDGLNWTFAGYVSRGAKEIESRNYASMYIYGNDMYVLSRSGDENAASFHNNNLITLHVVKNFRNLTASSSIAGEAAGIVVTAETLGDIAVESTKTFVDSNGTEWVTCQTNNGSKVYKKNSDGTYSQTLNTYFRLGEVVAINGQLYVFGTDDTRLVAYQYTQNSGWGSYISVREGNFVGAPSDVYVEGGKVYIAADEYDYSEESLTPIVNSWSAQRGYSNATGSVSDNGSVATLTGYGAATYSDKVAVQEGDSVSVSLSGMTLASAANQIDLLFMDRGNSFFNSGNDTGNGLRVNITSWGSLGGFQLKYCGITSGQKGTEISLSQVTSALATSTITYTLTKKTQTISNVDYTYVLSVTVTNMAGNVTNGQQTANIPASVLPADIFEDGVYLATGNQAVNTATQSNVYTVTHPVKKSWSTWWNPTTLTVQETTEGVTVNAASSTGAASFGNAFTLSPSKAVSTKITFNLSGNTSDTAMGVEFSTVKNMYYGKDDSSGYALGVQFSNLNTIQYFYCNNGTNGFKNISSNAVSFNKQAENLTYTVTLIDCGDSGYTLRIKLNNTVYTVEVPTSEMPANALTNKNLYLNTGNRATLSTGTYTVENPVSTATEKYEHYTYPVVLSASVSGFAPASATWTKLSGESFAQKIGDPAQAKLGLFGLPFRTVDYKTVGWSNAKLFKISGSDATDLRYRYYEAVNNGTGVELDYNNYDVEDNHSGLLMVMPVKNLGSNFAAMFMIDDEITTYGTPSGEEMILIRLPGGNYSFDLTYDSDLGVYWLATTEDTDSGDTRISLYYSYNAYDWLYAGALANGLTGDAFVSIAIDGLDLTVTANINGIKTFTVPYFRSLTGEYRDLANWKNTRGFNSNTLTVSNGNASFSGTGGARIASAIDIKEGTSLSFSVGTASENWTAGGKFTVGLVNADNSFVGGGNDTGSGFIIDIANNSSIGANMYLYTVSNGTPSGNINNLPGNKFNTKTFSEEQITGDGMEIVFTRRTHKDTNGVTCAWIISVRQSDGVILQKSIPVSQVAANLFDNGAYLIAGARYGAATNYTVSNVTLYSLYKGDINADYTFDAADLIKLCKVLLQDDEDIVCDLNGDGNVNILDLIHMKKMFAALS